jgi:hypothetical protein
MRTSGDSQARAMRYLSLALQLLDKSDTPADVGAHVDTAMVRLSEVMSQSGDAAQKVSQ